jgi:pentatricopeptide repeat protein
MDIAQSTWLRCMAEHDAGGPIMLSSWLGNAFLSACAHNGALSAASMAQSALLARGIALDARGYTSIMGSALRDKTLPTSAERLVHVRAALAALLDAGLQPTALTLNVLLVALGDCGLCSEAEAVVTEWLQRDNVTSNAYIYNTLIRCRVRCTQVPQAMHLFREMQANQVLPTSVTFALLLKACNAEGMQTAAEELRVLRQSLVVAGMLVEEYDADEEWQQPLPAEESFAPGAFWAAQSPPKPMIRPHPRGRVKRQGPRCK